MKTPTFMKRALKTALAFGTAGLALASCDSDTTQREHKFLNDASVSKDGIVTLVTEDNHTPTIDTTSYQIVSNRYEDNFNADSADIAYMSILNNTNPTSLKKFSEVTVISHGKPEIVTRIQSEDSTRVKKLNEELLAFTEAAHQQSGENYIGKGKYVSTAAADLFNGVYLKKMTPK